MGQRKGLCFQGLGGSQCGNRGCRIKLYNWHVERINENGFLVHWFWWHCKRWRHHGNRREYLDSFGDRSLVCVQWSEHGSACEGNLMAALIDGATGQTTVSDYLITNPTYPISSGSSSTIFSSSTLANKINWTSFSLLYQGITLLYESAFPEFWGLIGA